MSRSIWKYFVQEIVLKNFAEENTCVGVSFFQHRCFSVKFAQIIRTTILKKNCERLVLYVTMITGQEHAEKLIVLHTVKRVGIRSFSFIHFLVFESNTKIYLRFPI